MGPRDPPNGLTPAAFGARVPGFRGLLSTGVLLTAFTSSGCHLAPNNDRPAGDRLPTTIAFMGFFASAIGDRTSVHARAWLSGPLVWPDFVSTFKWRTRDHRTVGVRRPVGPAAGAGPSGAAPPGALPAPA